MSERGVEVCSEKCRLERKRIQDKESDYRRYHKESNTPKIYTCRYCGKEFEGLAHRYCSDTCRELARKEQVKENNKLYYEEMKGE